MSFFKLPKPVWKMTDDEYVERVRMDCLRIQPWKKAIRILWLLIVVVALVLSWMIVVVALDHPGGPEITSMIPAYVMGGMAGWFMGFALLKAVFLNVETWTTERAYRVMIAGWDRVRELERLLEQQGIKPPPADSPRL